jgi:hypothetical protein
VSSKPDEPGDGPEHAARHAREQPPASSIDTGDTRRPGAVALADELPVVARLVVEIRSDGRRTIARGALEDVVQGQRVAVEARGDSPLGLALGLARSILSVPMLARASARKLLGGRGLRRGRAPDDE